MSSVSTSCDTSTAAVLPIRHPSIHIREQPSWEQDYANRVNPALVTSLLRESVPVLDYADWRVTDVQDGSAGSLLPLNYETTNQHGTHQATLMTLAADYTGGLALATVIRGVPIVGVHPTSTDNTMLLWLLSINMNYKVPSTGDLRISCTVPTEMVEAIRGDFWAGRRGIYPLDVDFTSNEETVARAELTYFLQHAAYIRPRSSSARVAGLYRHKLKASARLIAGVRALENRSPNPLYSDPYSGVAAGKHGALLAERFTQILPPLRAMVAARTKHIDDCLSEALADGIEQVVTVGVGLDCRPFRLASIMGDTSFYELDLPDMLAERERALDRIDALPEVHRIPVPLNLEFDDVYQSLVEYSDFDPNRPTFVIFEGGSMYFERAVIQRIFRSMKNLLIDPKSRLWVDIIAREVAERTSRIPEVVSFVNALEKLGERFKFGHDEPARFLATLVRGQVGVRESGMYQVNQTDPIFSLYRFVILQPNGTGFCE